jgi:hypothetical protein
MEKEKGREPEGLPDETLDDASGGFLAYAEPTSASFPGFNGSITDGTSKTSFGPGFTGGVRVAVGDVNNDGVALKIADGSVKPGA